MPRCYLLTVCTGSSLDESSNNFSLFNLVEQVQVGAQAPAELVLPLEVHIHLAWSETEFDLPHELRWVVRTEGGGEVLGPVQPLCANSPHLRLRSFGLTVPRFSGPSEVRVEWRSAGSVEWTREPAWWPLQLAHV